MSDLPREDLQERVLLLAPTARDAALSRDILAAAGVRCLVCKDLEALCREAGRGAGAAVVPAEAVLNDRAGCLSALLRDQPAWSDMPVIVLTAAGGETAGALRALQAVGNMTLMPRPVSISTLVSGVRAALRDRRRQYQVRRHLAERERQAEALRRAEERLRLMVESASDYAIFTLDPQGRVTSWNAGAERLFGWSEAEILGRDGAVLFTPEDRAAGAPQREQTTARETGRAEDERWHIRKDGSRFFASGVLTPIRDGGLHGYTKIARDVTERIQAEAALCDRERQFRQLADAIPQIAWITDPQGRVEYVNRRWSDYTGLTLAESQVEGRLLDVIHPADRAGMLRQWQLSLGTGLDYEYQVRFRRAADGAYRWFLSRGVAVRDERGAVARWFGTSTDIETHKRAEEELREADRRKDEFLAMLGHELRNPLAPMRTAVEVLRRQEARDGRRERVYATLDRQITHLTRLVDDLLDVARITRGRVELQRQTVELAAVVDQAVEMAEGLIAARGHELTVTRPAAPLWLKADPTRLTQVVFNLLNNAAKYTEPGGRIWLTAGREGTEAVVRVLDTGVGIAPELLPRVFDLFTQGERTPDRSQGGLGLGLTLVRNLVELHGGTVRARSEGPGKGSEFILRLPALPAAPAPAPQAAPAPGRAARRARVLVVDDNVDVAEAVAMLLEDLGHEVKVAHSGPQALESVRTYRPEAVFLDLGLPGMDGYEVARRLRAEPGVGGVLLVALSGYGQPEDRRRSREAGFDEHLVKPVVSAALQPLLARLGTAEPGEAVRPPG